MRERELVIRLRLPRWLRRRWSLAGAVAVVGFGAIVYAAVPNVFSSGEPLSSAKINANFDSLDGRVTATEGAVADTHTKTTADARFTRLTSCYWTFVSCAAAGTMRCVVACEPGDYVVSGGCDGNAGAPSTIFESFPGPSSGNYKNLTRTKWPFGTPPSDPDVPVVDAWICRVSIGFPDGAYAFCCPPR